MADKRLPLWLDLLGALATLVFWLALVVGVGLVAKLIDAFLTE